MGMRINAEAISWPASILYRAWTRSMRFRLATPENLAAFVNNNRNGVPQVVAIWHNELFSGLGWGRSLDLAWATIISQSRDGELISQLVHRLGWKTARGSSHRGGVKALISARKMMLNENRVAVFTVDGPRGPRHKVKEGVIYLAHKTGARIVPGRFIHHRAHAFDSWDRFELPLPFSSCEVHIGEPYQLATETLDTETLEDEKRKLEVKLRLLGEPQGRGRPD
jgi:lysophospholipid acyltransferase (LPLAT)-like uncharacterized protein